MSTLEREAQLLKGNEGSNEVRSLLLVKAERRSVIDKGVTNYDTGYTFPTSGQS